MKILFTALMAISLACLFPSLTQASDGLSACSYHGGINCYAGADYDGSVICQDGWRSSSVAYRDVCPANSIYNKPNQTACDLYYTWLGSGTNPLSSGGASLAAACEAEKAATATPTYVPTYNNEIAVPTCPKNSTLDSSGYCMCNNGYFVYKDETGERCELFANICNFKYGQYSQPNVATNKCECMAGYRLDIATNKCINADTWCKNTYGQNAEYKDDGCTCMEGYEMGMILSPWCVKKNAEVTVLSTNQTEGTQSPATSAQSEDFVTEQIRLITTPDTLLINRLKGNILLQVQTLGAAWYLHPVTLKRYYLKDGQTAYEMLRAFGLGVSENDYAKIAAGDLRLKTKLKGRIILRTQAHGEAYYINPKDLGVTYLKDGEAAYQAMRNLSIGITNKDLSRIPIERFVPINK